MNYTHTHIPWEQTKNANTLKSKHFKTHVKKIQNTTKNRNYKSAQQIKSKTKQCKIIIKTIKWWPSCEHIMSIYAEERHK